MEHNFIDQRNDAIESGMIHGRIKMSKTPKHLEMFCTEKYKLNHHFVSRFIVNISLNKAFISFMGCL